MRITRSRPTPSMVILSVTGEIDATNAGELGEHLRYAISLSRRLVVVDLSHLSFLSISGLQALLDADAHARQRYRALCVVVGPRCVNRLLEVCGPVDLNTATTVAQACMSKPWIATCNRRPLRTRT
ncbi:STAS domain-containing protein [Nocardia tengchongensis]|uniref:STAS domain-containing protein n=1 Tax=Nocardia tengchongensis TaxID=2055889 RepID=UPI003652529B